MDKKYTLLGVSVGSINGNSETLLKIALSTASECNPNITWSLLRLQDLQLSRTTSNDPSPQGDFDPDGAFARDHFLAADAIIIASPTYTRQPPGILKQFMDQFLGPHVDASFNPSILKPRVGGLIAVGGATSIEWVGFTLPLLHQVLFPLHVKIVDQFQVPGYAFPGTVLLDGEPSVRARRLGENVASQVGREFEEAEYRGEEEKGGLSCPVCHLSAVIFVGGEEVHCATCGAHGKAVAVEGRIALHFEEEGVKRSVLTMEGKREHQREIRELAKVHGFQLLDLKERRKEFEKMGYGRVLVPPSKT